MREVPAAIEHAPEPGTPPPEEAWNAWSPRQLAERLKLAGRPWYVVGGWALDLWHGKQTRPHEDLEFAVLSEDATRFRAILHDLDFFTAHDGRLAYLPPTSLPPLEIAQLWGAQRQPRCWRVDMMLERGTAERWIYKRDSALYMPRDEAVRVSACGIAYIAPALVLLFKAKHRRDKDEQDFLKALPKLRDDEKAQLRRWLDGFHPGHDWLRRL